MKSNVAKLLLLVCTLLFAGRGVAGCGEMEGMCMVIRGWEKTEHECRVTVCANVYSYVAEWEIGDEGWVNVSATEEKSSIRLDGEPGFAVPSSILKDGLTCYSSGNLEKTYCAIDMSM